MLSQNGVISSIKPQQITYIVPGVENFDHTEISDFVQKAKENLVCSYRYKCGYLLPFLVCVFKLFFDIVQDPALLEFAWVELLEKNKRVKAEDLAEVLYFPSEVYVIYYIVTPQMTIAHCTDDIW